MWLTTLGLITINFLILCFVQDAISSAFDAAWQYAGTFEPYRQFYQENGSLDLEAIREEEHGIYIFNWLFKRVSLYPRSFKLTLLLTFFVIALEEIKQ